MNNLGVETLAQQALTRVFRGAARHLRNTTTNGDLPLLWALDFQPEYKWALSKVSLSFSQRRQQGWIHRHAGRATTAWEHPLRTAVGVE